MRRNILSSTALESVLQFFCKDWLERLSDITLEYEEKETYHHFREFYMDVLPEFKELGKVVQFKVCCNYEPHLRGNVYIQYRE